MEETKMKLLKTKRGVYILSIVTILVATLIVTGCWIKNIVTPYFTQTTNYYCGAASAQMILASAKIHINVNQPTLYSYIHSHNQCGGWATDPKGLKDVLNNYYPAGHFIAFTPTNQEDGVKKLAYTIYQYGVPPAALIYGCQHWVVVRGVATNVQPSNTGSYTIFGFWVNDPWYGANSLGENKYIAISSWKNDYFTGCAWCGAAGTTYISVVDPEPVPKITLKFAALKPRRANPITAEEARKFADEYLNSFKSQSSFRESFPDAFKKINDIKIETPLYVRRSDRTGDGYFIIPMQLKNLTTGAMILSGYSGELNEVSFLKKPIVYLPKFQTEPAIKLFHKNVQNISITRELLTPIPQARIKRVDTIHTPLIRAVKAKELKIEKLEMVWEPSEQTQNPYYPLWEVSGTVKEMKSAGPVAFMDMEGKVFHAISKAPLKGGTTKAY